MATIEPLALVGPPGLDRGLDGRVGDGSGFDATEVVELVEPLLNANAELVVGLWGLDESWERVVGAIGCGQEHVGGRRVTDHRQCSLMGFGRSLDFDIRRAAYPMW